MIGTDTISHPAITGTVAYRWTLDELRAAVIDQASSDAARGIAVAPWRGLARSMERLAPDWRDDAHRHPATYGACPLDEAADELGRLYADEEQAARASERAALRGDTLVSAATIARVAGVKVATVHTWTERHASFPAPAQTFGVTRVWRWSDVAAWLAIPRPTGRPRKG